ncbi:uncharacterized protein Z520_06793 [Fonsecaea multimorphosa CBS 102226]|uniref:FAD/NAD(P)-binding domain-containing protein n=1 Tax=Fonsecaea multimorphosa CBS 102226 TaxID=1442371 RepID=A0A0D2IJU5_9EURO|nr:uncharacterized protein Z520_06793 [Fonsecaea multimorphosa CBS 102226]KIX97341.1 hypothetical protein Z520_06793 [Fonsecaea multimorphosa CBS 102226]OAL23308.1 hypothetical protein AYO22_06358 [Fonsecaea multimorphosa]
MTPLKDGEAFNEMGWMVGNARGYRILEQPYDSTRKFRVIHIGAGASGITFSKFLEDRCPGVELQIYEKNKDIGGTWLENRYPGCACDIPSAAYQFTWERNPYWSQYYSEAPEIWQYFKQVVDKYGLIKYVKLEHTVIGAYWQPQDGEWEVHVRRPDGSAFVDRCNVLVNGGGILNNWKWPDIKGLHAFQGPLVHSANYDTSLDLKGKRVAVIGIGSSGIQIISKIASQVGQLYSWVRTPTWITAGFAQRFAGPDGANFYYTPEQQKAFAENPELFLKYSKMIESELNIRFKLILNGTPEAEAAKEFAREEMTKKLGPTNPALLDAIIPKNFGVGCRRPTPGNGFLEALIQDNVKVFTSPMQEINATGFVDSKGKQYDVDIIICATGFNTSWIPRFPVEANGHSISEMWATEAVSYLSIGVPNIPNYWTMSGPYGPNGHGSFLPVIETLTGNIIQCIQKMQKDRIKSLMPKPQIAEQLREHAQLFLKRTAWTGPCSSWFKQGKIDGPVPMFPASRLVYMDLMANPRFEDYQIEYMNSLNMFEFLGNGFAAREFDGRDLSYYLGLLGDDRQIDLEGDIHEDLEKLHLIQP